jgi:hypothetical protein
MSPTPKKFLIGAALTAGFAAAGIGIAGAAGSGDDSGDVSLSGTALERASAAALALDETRGGEVVDSEVEDEENGYEVEVNLADGRQIEVQLDENFAVVGTSENEEGDDGDGD